MSAFITLVILMIGVTIFLLLLNANPLNDVTNTERIAGVMAMGHWFTAEELQKRLVALRESY